MKSSQVKYFRCSICVILGVMLLVVLSMKAQALTVSPPRVQLSAKPGEVIPFLLNISNNNKGIREYDISYSYYTQDENGYQKEAVFDPEQSLSGPWDWVVIDSGEQFNIDGKDSYALTGFLKIPHRRDVTGYYNFLLNVREISPIKKSGVTLNYSTGSIFEVTVAGARKRPKIVPLEPLIHTDGKMVMLQLSNQSSYKGRLTVDLQVRNSKRKLVAKVPMLSAHSRDNQYPFSSLFPNNTLNLTGTLDEALEPGEYTIHIGGRFLVRSKDSDSGWNEFRLRSKKTKLVFPAPDQQEAILPSE